MLKVFEAFAGYGSQSMALKRLGIDFEVVGISEVDADAIISYAYIHCGYDGSISDVPKEEKVKYLRRLNIPHHYKTGELNLDKMIPSRLNALYEASQLSKNYGDIRYINPDEIPDFDLFTYSFPCQDVSAAGKHGGLTEGSNTKSSLLWECKKIIEAKKPKYLVMENVNSILGEKNADNFNLFLEYLGSLGYNNKYHILNAMDYDIPQSRRRLFCVSVLGEENKFVPPPIKLLRTYLSDLMESNVDDKYYLHNDSLEEPLDNKFSYCLDASYWRGTNLKTFLTKNRRQLVTDKQNPDGTYTPRKLTPRECLRLMDVSDDDIDKIIDKISDTQLYRLAGNSIVVGVLERIFKEIL